MKLLRVELEGKYKSLNNQVFDFSDSTGQMIVFAGLNGSGKSHLLELIVESFSYCERFFRFDFRTRNPFPCNVLLEYEINDPNSSQLIKYRFMILTDGSIRGSVDGEPQYIGREQIQLPTIVGYSSGFNENLQRPFLKNDLQYYDVMAIRRRFQERYDFEVDYEKKRQISFDFRHRYPGIFNQHDSKGFSGEYDLVSESNTKTPSGRFIDYDSNGLLLASLAVLPEDEAFRLLKIVGLDKLSTITLEYDLRNIPFTIDNVKDIHQLIDISSEGIIGLSKKVSDDLYNLYELDYLAGRIYIDLNNPYTKEKIQDKYFGEPLTLFDKLYKLQLLGIKNWKSADKKNLRRDDFLGNIKKPLRMKLPIMVENIQLLRGDSSIDYHDLSDGEAQLLLVLCTARIFSSENALFILDEPETHLNPSWRTFFHEYISSAIGNSSSPESAFQMIVSTHSPFIISALKKENVYRFQKKDNIVDMSSSCSITYGASFDVLIKQFFGLKTLVSQSVIKEIKIVLETMNTDEKVKWIEDNLGDSMEKSYLLGKLKTNVTTD